MKVLCGQCGKTLILRDSRAGQAILCPHCNRQIQLPTFTEPPPAPPALGRMEVTLEDLEDVGGFAEAARQSVAPKVRVTCEKCSRSFDVSARHAGKKAKCPSCQTLTMIPYPDDVDLALTALDSLEAPASEQLDVSDPAPESLPSAVVLEEPMTASSNLKKRGKLELAIVAAVVLATAVLAGFLIPMIVGSSQRVVPGAVGSQGSHRTSSAPATGPSATPGNQGN